MLVVIGAVGAVVATLIILTVAKPDLLVAELKNRFDVDLKSQLFEVRVDTDLCEVEEGSIFEEGSELPAIPEGLNVTPEELDELAKNPDQARANWIRPPEPEYPETASRCGIESGEVVFVCEAVDAGRLGRCVVIRETPAGYGFAEAARDGLGNARVTSENEDQLVRFRVKFSLE